MFIYGFVEDDRHLATIRKALQDYERSDELHMKEHYIGIVEKEAKAIRKLLRDERLNKSSK